MSLARPLVSLFFPVTYLRYVYPPSIDQNFSYKAKMTFCVPQVVRIYPICFQVTRSGFHVLYLFCYGIFRFAGKCLLLLY